MSEIVTDDMVDAYKREFQIYLDDLPARATINFSWNATKVALEAVLGQALAAKDEEIARYRDALETISVNMHGSNPSLSYADVPREDYLAHVLWEARQLARKALDGGEDADA